MRIEPIARCSFRANACCSNTLCRLSDGERSNNFARCFLCCMFHILSNFNKFLQIFLSEICKYQLFVVSLHSKRKTLCRVCRFYILQTEAAASICSEMPSICRQTLGGRFSFPGAKLQKISDICKFITKKNALLYVLQNHYVFVIHKLQFFIKCKVLRMFVRKNLHLSKICCIFALEIENNKILQI